MNTRRLTLSVAAVAVAFATFASVPAANAGGPCCEPEPVCCCPAPPVEVPLCVVDPCTGCKTLECICVPACCANEVPCMTWRKGLFGRKILTYKWKCCGHCVDVVITRRGDVKVKG